MGLFRRRAKLGVLAVLAGATTALLLVGGASAGTTLVPSSSGLTVYDTVHKVYWLADADLAATDRFGLPQCPAAGTQPCVNAGGSMTYTAALAWVKAMDTRKYMGVSDWQLPTTPNSEPHTATLCPRLGPKPYRNRFGFNCTDNALGSLFYNGLGLKAPDTAVAIPDNTVGPFSNLQPYLYWGLTPGKGGHTTFSFGNGYQGSNTDPNFLYLLPMIRGKIAGTPRAAGQGLEVNPGGQTVYDPVTRITWLANANLAAAMTFGLPRCASPTTPSVCVGGDGSMTWPAAEQFVKNMRAYQGAGYLGEKHWSLPAIGKGCPAYGCAGSQNPMGELFYDHLGLRAGDSAVAAPNTAVGPFNHIRPYLYWSCEAATIQSACKTTGAAPNFEWSFSFGSGFLGTDILANDLYVTAYYVPAATQPPPKVHTPGCGTKCV